MLLINYFQISGLYSNVSGWADTNSGIETCSTQELGIKFAQGNNCGFSINLNLGKITTTLVLLLSYYLHRVKSSKTLLKSWIKIFGLILNLFHDNDVRVQLRIPVSFELNT